MKRNNFLRGALLAALLFCGLAYQSCISDKVVDFKKDGVNITAYLENPVSINDTKPSYSEFLKWAKVIGVDGMLNARGNYTCFVPTDEAVMRY